MCGEDDSDFEIIDNENEDEQKAEVNRPPPGLNTTLVENFDAAEVLGEEDTINILVATDVHVGYGEKKANRYLDSVNTFEEVLQIATKEKVDMVLLAGDLFHENNPSRDMQHRVVQLLRRYCLNDNEVSLEFLSDPSVNFNQSRFDRVNYEDGNLNVGLPVFSIHGNHDDMAGKGLTALDLLHEAGLINLFGKFEEIETFEVSPILLRKGNTRLALYGIGSQRDDRLCRAFKDESIKFLRPQAGAEDWFNLFALHQNRPKRSNTRSTGAYLPEEYIPTFFDLVIWGHEHECKKDPAYVNPSTALGDGFYILQPGSTVATSLCPDEAVPKHVFKIKIRGRKWKIVPIPLETTRQVIIDELTLDKLPKGQTLPRGGIRPPGVVLLDELTVKTRIEDLIEKAKKERGPRQPTLPLIRLKVNYAGPWADMQPINARRIGAKYDDVVANALEMIVTKKVSDKQKKQKDTRHAVNEPLQQATAANIAEVINEHFENLPWQERLSVLTDEVMGDAFNAYAEDDVTATKANQEFAACINGHVNRVKGQLKKMPVPELVLDMDGEVYLKRFENTVAMDMEAYKRNIYSVDETAMEQGDGEDEVVADSGDEM